MKSTSIIATLLCILSLSLQAQEQKVKPLDMNLSNYEYPYPVEDITIHAQGQNLRMAYVDVKGTDPKGKAILLLHGKNFNAAYWAETAAALVVDGYRVVMPDQIGFGKSDKPEYFQYSFHQLAENTKNLLDTLGIQKVVVLGHSMGGMLATRFTLMYPDMVEKFVLVNPIGLEDYKVKVPYQSVGDWLQKELAADYESIKKYQLNSYYDGKWKPAYDEWVNILAGWTVSPDYPRLAWNAALTYDMIFTQPICYEFQHISYPSLLIIGQRDRTALGKNLVSDSVAKTMGYYPDLGKQTRNKIPNCKLVELDNVGHLPHIEAFGRFIVPLREFLKE